tara:strand:+ start:341 stop:574 length:234 start_codon:yes stop_codon:yes gene_type:complete
MKLEFKPMEEQPKLQGNNYSPECLLYSSCDGYHLVYAFFCPVTREFQHFANFIESKIENSDNYKAWALLIGEPEVVK